MFLEKFNSPVNYYSPSACLLVRIISEEKIIKRKILIQSKTESFFINNLNIEAKGTQYKHTKMKPKKHYAWFKMINFHYLWRSIFKYFLKPLFSHIYLLTQSFPMYPFSSSHKNQKTAGFLKFLGGRERVHWEQMG